MDKRKELEAEVARLRKENNLLREQFRNFYSNQSTVDVPPEMNQIFLKAQKTVQQYFLGLKADPPKANIAIDDSRYVLIRGSSLSYQFLNTIKDLYADRGEEQAFVIGRNFLFDVAHVLGAADAKNFHAKMKLEDPIERLSAGPVHFAFTGWAYVKIHPDSNPTPGKDFHLHFDHEHSFEAEAWIAEGVKPPFPVCIMNAGYASGWCEESFGLPLTAVEVSCKARGDKSCSFVMAKPDEISRFIPEELNNPKEKFLVPLFFERKEAEEKLRSALIEKDTLLKELHHRVKNNLQIVSSLISMQAHHSKSKNQLDFLDELKQRIRTIGLIHDRLQHAEEVELVGLADYIGALAEGIYKGLCSSEQIKMEMDFADDLGKLPIDQAISCGLIVNEALTNACKYAFPNGDQGEVCISGRRLGDRIYLEIKDNGVGIPQDRISKTSMGVDLIQTLVEQLDGELKILSIEGTRILFQFPLRE